MARFIEIPVNGNFPKKGRFLVSADNALYVFAPTSDSGSKTQIRMKGSGGVGATRVVLTHTTTTTGAVKDAINKALTSNPGGKKAFVDLPAGITITNIEILG
jgi:hypothetical protein